jgi:Zn-dependent M32 family carboxypeptidase
MPEGGAVARGRQRAMLCQLAHERAVEPALDTLIDALAN